MVKWHFLFQQNSMKMSCRLEFSLELYLYFQTKLSGQTSYWGVEIAVQQSLQPEVCFNLLPIQQHYLNWLQIRIILKTDMTLKFFSANTVLKYFWIISHLNLTCRLPRFMDMLMEVWNYVSVTGSLTGTRTKLGLYFSITAQFEWN